MAVTAFQDLPLADSDRSWDGAAAEKRVRAWAGAEDEPTPRYRDARRARLGANRHETKVVRCPRKRLRAPA